MSYNQGQKKSTGSICWMCVTGQLIMSAIAVGLMGVLASDTLVNTVLVLMGASVIGLFGYLAYYMYKRSKENAVNASYDTSRRSERSRDLERFIGKLIRNIITNFIISLISGSSDNDDDSGDSDSDSDD